MIEIKLPLEKAELDQYMPHKEKMYLLSRVLDYDVENSKITTQCDVSKENIFFDEEEGGIPNWAGFELMAQSISALTGISNALRGRTPLPGMILSVSEFISSVDFYKEGETVTMRVEKDYYDAETNIFRYLCWIFKDDEEIVSAKITVMEVEDIEVALKK